MSKRIISCALCGQPLQLEAGGAIVQQASGAIGAIADHGPTLPPFIGWDYYHGDCWLKTRRCGNCKHWIAPTEAWQDGWGECSAARGEVGHPYGPLGSDAKAYAQDSDDWKAYLRTRPDFGCIQWEPQEVSG